MDALAIIINNQHEVNKMERASACCGSMKFMLANEHGSVVLDVNGDSMDTALVNVIELLKDTISGLGLGLEELGY